jgi:hypothetical protein
MLALCHTASICHLLNFGLLTSISLSATNFGPLPPPKSEWISHRIASHRIASHRIASHRIASHRIASLSPHTLFTQSKTSSNSTPHSLMICTIFSKALMCTHDACTTPHSMCSHEREHKMRTPMCLNRHHYRPLATHVVRTLTDAMSHLSTGQAMASDEVPEADIIAVWHTVWLTPELLKRFTKAKVRQSPSVHDFTPTNWAVEKTSLAPPLAAALWFRIFKCHKQLATMLCRSASLKLRLLQPVNADCCSCLRQRQTLRRNQIADGVGQMVVRMGVGYDNVDIKVAGEMGIPVANVPNYGTEEVRLYKLFLVF